METMILEATIEAAMPGVGTTGLLEKCDYDRTYSAEYAAELRRDKRIRELLKDRNDASRQRH